MPTCTSCNKNVYHGVGHYLGAGKFDSVEDRVISRSPQSGDRKFAIPGSHLCLHCLKENKWLSMCSVRTLFMHDY